MKLNLKTINLFKIVLLLQTVALATIIITPLFPVQASALPRPTRSRKINPFKNPMDYYNDGVEDKGRELEKKIDELGKQRRNQNNSVYEYLCRTGSKQYCKFLKKSK